MFTWGNTEVHCSLKFQSQRFVFRKGFWVSLSNGAPLAPLSENLLGKTFALCSCSCSKCNCTQAHMHPQPHTRHFLMMFIKYPHSTRMQTWNLPMDKIRRVCQIFKFQLRLDGNYKYYRKTPLTLTGWGDQNILYSYV